MKYDKPTIAILIGVLSTLSYEVFTRILIFLGIGKYSIYQLDSLIVTINRPDLFLGVVISSLVSGTVAIVLYYAFEKLGADYLVIKCVFISLLAWGILEAVFTASIEGRFIPIRPISDYYIHFTGAIILGIILGLLFKRFLFKKILL